jgi:hypothetical protein
MGNQQAGSEVMVGSAGLGTVELWLFPGEVVTGDTAMGAIYVRVRGDVVKRYDACAGPPPGFGHLDRGGHSAEPTGAGHYVLARGVHYTTQSWPTSTIPWGAQVRARADGEIEFSADGGATWRPATGADGVFTTAWVAFEERGRAAQAAADNAAHAGDPAWQTQTATPLTSDEIANLNQSARGFFTDDNGNVAAVYLRNDFGVWAWNLQLRTGSGPERTGMFVHTTPDNEAAAAAGQPVVLENSHGCVHIRPADRDEMMSLGYLAGGVSFVVKPYGVTGP